MFSDYSATGASLDSQIGANSGDALSVSTDLRIDVTGANGVTDAAISTQDLTSGAAAAIGVIDNAIGDVSTARSTLGATQNRLEHVVNNLSVAVENLTASESRIRDTDMAMEMANFTKHQILSQAGTAMLTQANAVPQNVLSLLR